MECDSGVGQVFYGLSQGYNIHGLSFPWLLSNVHHSELYLLPPPSYPGGHVRVTAKSRLLHFTSFHLSYSDTPFLHFFSFVTLCFFCFDFIFVFVVPVLYDAAL
jgi:hypothetical protein